MDDYIPYAYTSSNAPDAANSNKQHWINIAISVISRILTDRAGAGYYFGLSTSLPIAAASDLASRLKREC